jgi:hypothetical protein
MSGGDGAEGADDSRTGYEHFVVLSDARAIAYAMFGDGERFGEGGEAHV